LVFGLCFDPDDPCVVTTGDAPEVIVEDSDLSILKVDSDITESAGQFRPPFFNDSPHPPPREPLVINPVSYLKVE